MRRARLIALLAAGATTVALAPVLAAPGVPIVTPYWLAGAAVESINPTPDMIKTGSFFLGGYGLGSGRVGNRPELQAIDGRAATGILGKGVSSRAVVFSDGQRALTLAQIETQGYFSAYKQGPFGIVDIRRDAATKIAELRAKNPLLPEMNAGAILVDSNHSHGGPDTAGVWGGVPTDYLKLIHDQTVKAIVRAYTTMRPASLVYGEAHGGVEGRDANPLLTNQFSHDPANAAMDDGLRVFQAKDAHTGKVIVTYLNFSAHPTVLGSSNTLVTADYTGILSDKLASFGGVGFQQVGTLGRTQPARDGCPNPKLKDAAASLCALNEYATRVFVRAKQALAVAKPAGPPKVNLHSYLINDTATNAALVGLSYVGTAIGAPIYRAVNPPWFDGPVIGAPVFSGRIGDILISGGPGEMYPQIPLTVQALTRPRGMLSIGTAGDFLGYIIAPFEAYPEPIRRSMFDGEPFPTGSPSCDPVPLPSPLGCPSPIDNDTYFFNASHTFGERLTCALLRGAGDAMQDNKAVYWSTYNRCPAFASDYLLAPDLDTTFPAQPDLSGLPIFAHLTPEFVLANSPQFFCHLLDEQV